MSIKYINLNSITNLDTISLLLRICLLSGKLFNQLQNFYPKIIDYLYVTIAFNI
jgi:hypothetical protein